ncbi:hypothetical protein STENM327S_04983 [Streptomyces tendae]
MTASTVSTDGPDVTDVPVMPADERTHRHVPPEGSHRHPQADPLAGMRTPQDPPWDVYLTGTVFLDVIFTGLDSAPVRGTESWARGMGSSPGGIANMATALARLGLRTSLAAAFGDDHYGDYCWDALSRGEGIDLTPSRTVPGWHSPVTVSMAYEGERTMVSHGHEPPPEEPSPLPARRPRRRRLPRTRRQRPLDRPGRGPAAPASSPTSAGTTPAPGTWPRCPTWRTARRSCPTRRRPCATPAPPAPAPPRTP